MDDVFASDEKIEVINPETGKKQKIQFSKTKNFERLKIIFRFFKNTNSKNNVFW